MVFNVGGQVCSAHHNTQWAQGQAMAVQDAQAWKKVCTCYGVWYILPLPTQIAVRWLLYTPAITAGAKEHSNRDSSQFECWDVSILVI